MTWRPAWATMGLIAASLLVLVVGPVARFRYRHQPDAKAALTLAITAALPGALFFVHVSLAELRAGSHVLGDDLVSFPLAMMWLFAGPVFLASSFFRALPFEVPRVVDFLRLLFICAWLAMSCEVVIDNSAF